MIATEVGAALRGQLCLLTCTCLSVRVITEPAKMPPKDVEIIVLQTVETVADCTVIVTDLTSVLRKKKKENELSDRINLYMDESEQLYPEQSTTAILAYHWAAKSFSISRLPQV